MPANGLTSLRVRTLTTGGLIAVVGALGLGILGMHGLTQHGASPVPASRQSVAAVSVDPHAAHPAPHHKPVATETGTQTSTETSTGAAASASPAASPGSGASSPTHGSASDIVRLCGAMLLAAAAGLLLALRLVQFGHLAPASLRPLFRVPAFPATARAGTGPPPVWEFSVVRC